MTSKCKSADKIVRGCEKSYSMGMIGSMDNFQLLTTAIRQNSNRSHTTRHPIFHIIVLHNCFIALEFFTIQPGTANYNPNENVL